MEIVVQYYHQKFMDLISMKNKIKLNISSFLLLNFLMVKNALAQTEHPLGDIVGIGDYANNLETESEGAGNAPELLEDILSNVIGFLTILAGLYFIVMFIVGGLGWASAGGDSNKVEAAKQRMTNAAIGLIIVVAAYSVAFIIGKVLGFEILEPTVTIPAIGPR